MLVVNKVTKSLHMSIYQ